MLLLQKLITIMPPVNSNNQTTMRNNTTKNVYMQKIVTILFISASVLMASCGSKPAATVLAEKKATLDSLKTEQQKIADAILKLEGEIAKLDTAAGSTQKAALVSLSVVGKEDFKHYLDLQGKVEAVNISYVTPRNGTGGQVKELYVVKGQSVHKGQLLLKLDDLLPSQNVKTAQQSLNAAQVQYNNLADVYKRRKSLFDQGIGTVIQLNGDKAAADNAQAQLNAAQENLKTAQEQVNFTNVYSDVDGVAEDVNVRVGEFFTPSALQIKIVNTNNLKVTANVPENYTTSVNEGDSILVVFPDINKTIKARISVAGKIIDPNSRSFYIEVRLPTDKDLKPNQIANVKIQDYSAANAITIPVNTLQTDEKGKYVLVAENVNGKLTAKKKPVTVGQSYGEKVQILSGLEAGDQLVTEGYQSLYNGQPLKITL